RHQHLGTATKQVNLDSETLEAVDTPPASFQVSRAVPEQTAIDLQLNIMRRDGETLQWSILAPSIGVNEGAISRLSEEQAQAAASRLAADFQQAGFDGPGPWNGLQNLGKMIRAAFPDRLEPIMHQVQEKLGDQALTLLLSTDEPFVPWELALLDQALLPENELLFLGNQTQMGRWWMHNQVPAQPPQALEIGQITALSGHYTLAARQVRLPEAEKEREHLVNTYQAIPLEADKATLDSLAKQGDTEPPKGHLMHIALHGFSDPRASSSGLFLTTGEVFPASFLVGGYRPGETPPIAFCFLNACQVGTENTFLGQASGFPGILLLNGAQGFLAPLWSVQDVLARELAEGFYEQALQEGKTLGEILQNLRDSYEIRGNLTPLAYVYYGHPGLKLTYSTP
ncbi:MAG: CHAT domain-containing protein, partial [Bacteroidota bacterium]